MTSIVMLGFENNVKPSGPENAMEFMSSSRNFYELDAIFFSKFGMKAWTLKNNAKPLQTRNAMELMK